ncbi:tautomerase [Salinigranum rubrum]|uniref:Tautomerase n=1 Tax=Salinigranum rubrum TaxID=755307 RepID=A0A2I8VP14_9EURY|nr:tautomerase [Salinigranum rubrum]AUV83662.1 tautomerase [Salinigranum rubrum]
MPHLRFETTATPADRTGFVEWVTAEFADVMETGTGHVGVSIRVCDRRDLSMGRAGDDEDVVLVNADIRAGRSEKQRRTLAASIIESVSKRWGVPEPNVYLVYTEHGGRDFHLAEGALASWDEVEAETGAGRHTG